MISSEVKFIEDFLLLIHQKQLGWINKRKLTQRISSKSLTYKLVIARCI